MRRLVTFLAVVLLVALAAPAAARSGPKETPFKGSFAGELLGFDFERVATRCASPEATFSVTSFEGWGNATHMGKTYVYAEHCSYLGEGGMPDGTYGEGTLVMIAANGDILRGTYTGGTSIFGPNVFFEDFFTFVDGGTGRFSEADGGGVEAGYVDFSAGPIPGAAFALDMMGVIRYDAFNRRI